MKECGRAGPSDESGESGVSGIGMPIWGVVVEGLRPPSALKESDAATLLVSSDRLLVASDLASSTLTRRRKGMLS